MMSTLFPALPTILSAADAAPSDADWQAAEALFKERRWAEAEKAFAAYARRFPPPPRKAEALAMAGRSCQALEDYAGARRHFEAIIREPALLRSEPDAAATAFDSLHLLLLAENKPAVQRRRLLTDFQRKLPASPLAAKAHEREADALLAAAQAREALDSYRAAATWLSPTGTNIVALLEGSLATVPSPLSEDDLSLLLSAARSRPQISAGLVAILAWRKEGWRAEDMHAHLLLEAGKAEAAAGIWQDLIKRRRGPADNLALSRAEALGAAKFSDGIAAYREWLKAYPQSSLRERAEAQLALLLAGSGHLAEATAALAAFLERYPQSRFAPAVDEALKRSQAASAKIAGLEAERAAKEEALRDDPALAALERAEELFARKRYDLALNEFMSFRSVRQHPLWGRAWHGLGQTFYALGQTDKALDAWTEIQRRAVINTNIAMVAESYRASGDAYLEDRADPARALAAYGSALRLKPDLADGAFDLNRGLALLMQGETAQAVAIFTERRDDAAADQVEFQRWDNLARQCAAGHLAPLTDGLPPTQRRAQADLAMGEALSAVGSFDRALRHYRRAIRPLSGQTGEDLCALGMARAYAALNQPKEALRLFTLFKERFPRSPLAPEALLRAGVLSASPRVGDFRQAREWFDLLAKRHPGTPETLAAEFYSATLAWREGKWAEAERLHKAFAAAHPDSPLAHVALEERLPAIAERSLEAPLRAPADRTNEVIVNPGSRKRSAFPISKDTSYSAQLDVKSADLPFKETWIENIDSRGGTALWTGPTKLSSKLHRYHLANAYSSQEYVMVRGDFLQPAGSGGPGGLPPFRVTVPSVDVDWTGFEAAGDETGEETRFVIVPLNTNSVDDTRHVLLWDPYDDDERNARPTFTYGRHVNPNISLNWDAKETFLLVDSKGTPHSKTILATGSEFKSKDMDGALKYTLAPLPTDPVPKLSFRIYAEGQETPDGKALDNIRGRAVLVDLDVEADGNPGITDADEPLEEDPGGYACLCTNSLTPIKLKVAPAGLPGKVTLAANVDETRIKLWQNADRTGAVTLPKSWPAGAAIPDTLYVEGVTNSASARDIALTLTYDENPPGENTPFLKCDDGVRLTMLSVDLLQYEEPGGTWIDINETLYVLKGSTVTFRAVSAPVVGWPCGTPRWEGSSGASGSGETKAVIFTTLSTTLTDYKTVTATCGNSMTANIIVYDLMGELTPDDNFAGRNLEKYGVEETVALSHTTTPAGIAGLPLRWKKSSGKGSVSGSSYDAEAIAGSVTLRLELKSGPSKGLGRDYVKTVVAPVNRFIRHATLTGAWHKQGHHSVKFKGQSYLDPKDVSFTNIQRREGASTAATGTGLFLFADGYVHPVGSWFTPSNPNISTGCYVASDTTGFDLGPGGTLGDSGLMSNYFINYEYRGDDGVISNMGTIESSKEVEAAGDSKAKKGAVGWVSKHLNDADSSY